MIKKYTSQILIFLFIIILGLVNGLLPIQANWSSFNPKNRINSSNPVVYFEIPVNQLDRAIQFYQSVFGFDFVKENIDGNEMALFPIVEGNSGISGALAKGKIYKPTKKGTLIYFHSENIAATLAKVQKSGGKILYPRTAVGDTGFVAEFEDSEGNRIALHSKEK
jgi:uncharacterized protein